MEHHPVGPLEQCLLLSLIKAERSYTETLWYIQSYLGWIPLIRTSFGLQEQA